MEGLRVEKGEGLREKKRVKGKEKKRKGKGREKKRKGREEKGRVGLG